MRVNLNVYAAYITDMEGKKHSLSIGQVKEVLGCLGRNWRELGIFEALKVFAAIYKRAGRA